MMKGSCLCGSVTYEIDPPLALFQYCHCSRCRKVSGSAHAASLFVAPSQFRWLTGEADVARFEPTGAKYYASCFCTTCGSSLPGLVQGGRNVVVPAGTLDDDPELRPRGHIYWDSKAPWYHEVDALEHWEQLPPRR
jgi:hypothetical protein